MRYISFDALKKRKQHSPEFVLLIGFLVIIFFASFLLFMPFSNNFENLSFNRYIDCLFTSVSCVCVTGLSTVSASGDFTVLGQAIMLVLIQVGGLGFMTLAVMISRIVRRRVTPKEQIITAQAYGLNSNEDVGGLVKRVASRALIIEGAGAVLLLFSMIKYAGSFGQALWMSVFHSVSAFCNAGFDLFPSSPGSLIAASQDYFMLSVLMVLILVGGIGFVVWDDLLDRVKRKKRKLSVYTTVILVASLFLLLFGMLGTSLFEWNNPETIGNNGVGGKLFASLFHSVSLRTAGFAAFSNKGLTEMGKLFSCILMFIGGCSGSTAGGIKVGTVVIILCAVINGASGKKNLTIKKRNINPVVFQRAISLFFIGVFIVFLFTGIIALIENTKTIDVIYEVVSAFGTVGVSANLTASLCLASKLMLMMLMYIGRVGVLTVTTWLMARNNSSENTVKYPDTAFYVG